MKSGMVTVVWDHIFSFCYAAAQVLLTLAMISPLHRVQLEKFSQRCWSSVGNFILLCNTGRPKVYKIYKVRQAYFLVSMRKC